MFNPIRKYYDSIMGDAGTGASIGGMVGPEGALIGAGAGALIGAVSGLFQKKRGNALLKQNPYPTETIPPEELANQQAAQRMADEGMPSAQYTQAQKNIQNQQAAAIAAAQDRRQGGAIVPAIQAESNAAQGNLDANSAEMRRQNQLNLQTVNSRVGSYRQQAFDWNQKQKYLQNYQMGQSLIGVGNANILSGADKLLGGLTQGYASGLFSSGNKAYSGYGGNVAANDTSLPGLANTSSSVGSPAANVSYINPNASALIQ